MRISILSVFFLLFTFSGNAQVFWTEDFTNGCTANCLASGFSGVNGAWTVTSTGVNGSDPNQWYVSCAENGEPAGSCGVGCGSDASLHVGANATVTGDIGAAYFDGGFGFWFPTTDSRAESPVINCTGSSNITLSFNYIENGDGTIDDATLWYNDGVSWTQIDPLAKTPLTCAPQGTWTAFSTVLPASANNNPNVRIGFRWVNNDDGVATDPSFAVDDITLSVTGGSPPLASFTASATTICEGQTITFTNTSTGSPTSYNWAASPATYTFAGGTSATDASPQITFNVAGTYTVGVMATNASGSDTATMIITVNACTLPVASFTADINPACIGQTVTFTDATTGTPTSWAWSASPGTFSFTGGTSASSQNPQMQFSAAGTYTVTLIAANASGSDTATLSVTVNNCPAPVAFFTASANPVCENVTVTFTDGSTNGPTSWNWSVSPGTFTFTGGTTAGSQNPQMQFTTAGVYTITLIVSNANGSDTTSVAVTVNSCPGPVAFFTSSANPVCENEIVTFTDGSTNGPTAWSWSASPATFTFAGGTSATSQNPQMQFTTAGIYTITLIVSNSSGSDTTSIAVTVNSCPPPDAGFTILPSTACVGQTVYLTDTSLNAPTSWSWTITPGTVTFVNATSSASQNPQVEFSAAGTYSVTLTVSNSNGTDSVTMMIDVITCLPPVASFYTSDTTICTGDCIMITNTSTDASIFAWSFQGADPDTSNAQNPGMVCYEDPGYYTILLYVSNGADFDTLTHTIAVIPSPVLFICPDTTIDLGTTASLYSNGSGMNGTYIWTPEEDLSCTGCPNPVAFPFETTTYYLTYIYNSCPVYDSVTVFVNTVDGIGVPNAFSPNGDGVNDELFVLGQGFYSLKFTVYNRYGQRVFETTDQTVGWDGTMQGQKVNTGVFVWYLDYLMESGESGVLKGNVTLIR